jgi:hypothetical protein
MDINIKELIHSIYEQQKVIIFTRRLIRVMEADGIDTKEQKKKIEEAEKEITRLQKILSKKY